MITIEQSLRNWGTISFATEIMKSRIGIGEPIMDGFEFKGFDSTKGSTLCFMVWMAFVPECYRSKCVNIAAVVGQQFLGRALGSDYLDLLVHEMEQRLLKELPA